MIHQTRKQLKTSKQDKNITQNRLDRVFLTTTIQQWSLYFGEFFYPSDPRCHRYPVPHTDTGNQIGWAVVT